MDFETFWAGFDVAPPETINLNSKPVEVLRYIKSKGLLAADIDFLDDYIAKHTPEHPDDEDIAVGEIEDFRDRAADAIEADEIRWEEAVNNPDHPDHAKELALLNK